MSLRPTGFNNTSYHREVLTEDEVVSTTEVVDAPTGEVRIGFVDRWVQRLADVHPAAWFTGAGALLFAMVFGRLGVDHHNNFGTWSYDMGIYDQVLWLLSRGGQSFMTVRGMEFWGHHLNLVVLGYVPCYWLGAGPAVLFLSPAGGVAGGAAPVSLSS